MPSDPTMLIGLGVGAIVVLWLVFSVLKKLIGFVFLGAIVLAGFLLWTNPGLQQAVMNWLPR